jgi:hypothetical protein
MFLGVATLFVIVIVFVLTASAGAVVGLLGPVVELDPELLPHAAIANAPRLAMTRAKRNLPVLICISGD